MSRFILAVLGSFLGSSAALAADWKPVAPANGSFRAEMPGEPKVLDQSIDNPVGPIHQVVHYVKLDGALYSVQVIETPPRGSLDARKAAAKLEREQYIRSNGGKLVSEEALFADGLPGADFVLQGPAPGGAKGTVTSRVRMLVADRAVYVVSVLSPRDKPLPGDAGRLFDSFRPGGSKATAGAKAAGTPEEALRDFMLAMILADEPKVRALALPAEGIETLWKGIPAPPEQADAIRDQMAAQPIRAMKPGEAFTLPGNRKMTVAADEVADDRAVLLPEGAPTPTRMRQVDGRWKVDARPFIAARKAAAAARAKAEAKARANAKKSGN